MISKLRPSRTMNTPSGRVSGQVYVLVALGIVVLLGSAGLVFDVGRLWLTRQQMQKATDAAAKAGANEIANQNEVTSSVQAAGIYDATQNGFTAGQSAPNGGTVTSVAVNTPPTAGPYVGQQDYVEAIITASVPTYFLSVFGFTTVPISTRATAKPNPAPVCIWTLDTEAQHDLVIGTGPSGPSIVVNAPNCEAYVDSDNQDPIGTHGGDCLHDLQTFSVGGFQDDGGCSDTPPVQQDAAPVADPLADTPEPSAGGCSYGTTAFLITSTSTTTTCGGVTSATLGTCNLSPGTYCGGIETGSVSTGTFVQGNTASAVTIHFASGEYVLNGGGMQIGPAFVSSSTSTGPGGDPNPGPASPPATPTPPGSPGSPASPASSAALTPGAGLASLLAVAAAPAGPAWLPAQAAASEAEVLAQASPGSSSTTSTGQTCTTSDSNDFSPDGLDEPVPPSGVTSNVTLTGSGVSFYNTGSSSTFEPISIFATASSNLSAANTGSSGVSEGILFFQDRGVGSCTENLIYGGTYTGTFYFENSLLGFGGVGGTYNYFIADQVEITTNLTINIDTSGLAGGSLVKIGAALAE
jgi:Flp pilus assembly protein TadG